MGTVNITVDATSKTYPVVTDAAAYEGKHLFRFFTDGKNVFNKATEEYNGAIGQVEVEVGVGYTVEVPLEDALLLDGVVNTYKHYGEATSEAVGPLEQTDNEFVLKNEGSVTVDNIEAPLPAPVAYVNSNRQRTATVNTSATQNDDTIFVNAAEGTKKVVTMPDPALMIGKRIRIKRDGIGDVGVNDKDAVELIELNDEAGNMEFEATASAWKLFR